MPNNGFNKWRTATSAEVWVNPAGVNPAGILTPPAPARFIVGIDPGVDTGVAIWDRVLKNFLLIRTTGAYKAMLMLRTGELLGVPVHQVFFRVEDARLRRWIPREATESAERGRREGAGSVKRDCSMWQEFLEEHQYPHEFVAPKNNKTKWKEAPFMAATGWTKRTSEHARDAAMLVFKF
jgi:hypothetical protein